MKTSTIPSIRFFRFYLVLPGCTSLRVDTARNGRSTLDISNQLWGFFTSSTAAANLPPRNAASTESRGAALRSKLQHGWIILSGMYWATAFFLLFFLGGVVVVFFCVSFNDFFWSCTLEATKIITYLYISHLAPPPWIGGMLDLQVIYC